MLPSAPLNAAFDSAQSAVIVSGDRSFAAFGSAQSAVIVSGDRSLSGVEMNNAALAVIVH